VARQTGEVHRYPAKIPSRKPEVQWIYFYIIIHKGEVILTKRGTEGIWKSLYQFPALESSEPCTDDQLVGSMLNQILGKNDLILEEPGDKSVILHKVSEPVKHELTHRRLFARFIHVDPGSWPATLPVGWKKISFDHVDDYAVPRLINRYMEVANFSYL
jgi:A/G-specific adenine glycosylase